MEIGSCRRAWILSGAAFLISILLAPDCSWSFPTTEADLIDAFVLSEADRDSDRNQSESSAKADNSTTLVERSSVPDFVGLAANLASLMQESEANDERDNSFSGTISMATVAAAASGAAPGQDDYFYEGAGIRGFLRGTAFIAGYDDPTTGDLRPARRLGFKSRLLGDPAANPKGGNIFKSFPATILARPARSVFQPQRLTVEPFEVRPFTSGEQKQLKDLKEAAKLADDRAREAAGDPGRWAEKVCSRSDLDGKGKTRVGQFFPDQKAGRLSRAESAYRYSADYLYFLVCSSGHLAPLIDPSHRAELLALVAPLVQPSGLNNGASYDAGAAEIAFGDLLDVAYASVRNESLALTPMGGDATPGAVLRRDARKVLVDLRDRGILTPLGQAARHWALGERSEAIKAMRGYVSSLPSNAVLTTASAKKVSIHEASGALADEINKRTELSVQYLAKQRRGMEDTHSASLILEASPLKDCERIFGFPPLGGDCNYLRTLHFTMNAGLDVVDDHESSEKYGGNVAVEVSMPFDLKSIFPGTGSEYEPDLRENLPVLSFSGRSTWLAEGKDQYVGQAKLLFKLPGGAMIPLTFTVTDRTTLQSDPDLRAQLGLSMDTSRLLSLFKTGLAPEPEDSTSNTN